MRVGIEGITIAGLQTSTFYAVLGASVAALILALLIVISILYVRRGRRQRRAKLAKVPADDRRTQFPQVFQDLDSDSVGNQIDNTPRADRDASIRAFFPRTSEDSRQHLPVNNDLYQNSYRESEEQPWPSLVPPDAPLESHRSDRSDHSRATSESDRIRDRITRRPMETTRPTTARNNGATTARLATLAASPVVPVPAATTLPPPAALSLTQCGPPRVPPILPISTEIDPEFAPTPSQLQRMYVASLNTSTAKAKIQPTETSHSKDNETFVARTCGSHHKGTPGTIAEEDEVDLQDSAQSDRSSQSSGSQNRSPRRSEEQRRFRHKSPPFASRKVREQKDTEHADET